MRITVAGALLLLGVLVSAASAATAADGDYSSDLKRIQEITLMYGPSIFQSNPALGAENLKQLPGARAERDRIAKKYAELMQGKTLEGRNIAGVLKRFDMFVEQFEAAARQYGADAPGKIDQDIDQALKMGQDAVDHRRPLYFSSSGGIAQHLGWAQGRLDVLTALSPDAPATAKARQDLDQARQKVARMKGTLNDAIISSNAPPRETYNGPDKAQLIQLVQAKWREAGVTGDVLMAGINSKSWKRNSGWKWGGGDTWNKSDMSRIQGFVIVKTDATHAAIHYINLNKDHMAEDHISADFVSDPKQPPDVTDQLLLKNVK